MCLGLLVVGYANTTRAYTRNNSHGCQHHHSHSPFSSKCQTPHICTFFAQDSRQQRRRPKPPREQRSCCHCSMQAVEDEQHSLFDCPFCRIIRGQHFSLLSPKYQQRDIRLFFKQNSHQLGLVAHHIHLCFQARMSDEPQLAPHPRL